MSRRAMARTALAQPLSAPIRLHQRQAILPMASSSRPFSSTTRRPRDEQDGRPPAGGHPRFRASAISPRLGNPRPARPAHAPSTAAAAEKPQPLWVGPSSGNSSPSPGLGPATRPPSGLPIRPRGSSSFRYESLFNQGRGDGDGDGDGDRLSQSKEIWASLDAPGILDKDATYYTHELPSVRLRPVSGRTVHVTGAQGLEGAFTHLDALVRREKLFRIESQQRFHERQGLKKKRLRMVRWRYRFKQGFRATVRRVQELANQGW